MFKKYYTRYFGNIQVKILQIYWVYLGGKFVISYAPLWKTMNKKQITTYTLIKRYGFSRGTLDSLKQGRNISTMTLNDLCHILSCRVEDVIEYIPDNE